MSNFSWTQLSKFASSHEKFDVWPSANVPHNLRRRSRKLEVLESRMGGGFLSLRLAGGLVWWNARESYQENRAETKKSSISYICFKNSYCAHTASIILNHWKLEFFWNYLQASTQRICVLRSQYCCVLKAIHFGKVDVFLFFYFSLPSAVAETFRFLELCWLLFFCCCCLSCLLE